MTTSSNQFDLSLAHQAMFSVSDAAGVQILCREGSVWVTLDNDPRDIVLDAGDSFLTTEHRRALIYAMEPSALSLVVAPSVVAAHPAGRTRAATAVKVTFALQPA
ncbi:DUF2917 domain-containing protein [Polaromonas sp. A23]|uniref:DUF2917 domain-containing protein n=1 Tax=Polaromonas sp. A23 TaxID=1944133 RepID=UPI000987D128|nr:DUF2917 domain-containing protein [Polaromonas sp. A23]OOG39689.1 hypothetical protein B0B52_13690 [Polaromonas sp. A23]